VPVVTIVEALRDALAEELERDERVVLFGEDVKLSPYGIQKGLYERFGPSRVRNTPLSEAAFVGAGIGAALAGLRPVVDVMVGTFTYVAMDQLYNQAAKLRYMSGGQTAIPVVYLATSGAAGSAAAQHSDSPYSLFMGAPGLKVVLPSTPYDAKGLLKAAIRDDNPVLFFEPLALLGEKGEVPEGDFVVPLGRADVKRAGVDGTIVAIGAMVKVALEAAAALSERGVDVEVVDVRTARPLDADTILDSIRRTRRLVVVDEGYQPGLASEVAALAAEHALDALAAPVVRVTTPTVPIPFSPPLEQAVIPDAQRVVEAVSALVPEPIAP
jgi:pyruvate/2-oxoglutarate/acetoin dehydrogenase E1 component